MKRAMLFILGVAAILAVTSCAGGASGGGGAEEAGSLRLSIGTGTGRAAGERAGLFASGSLKVDIAGDDGFTASETTSIVNGQGSVSIKGLKVGSTINVTATVTTNENNVYSGSSQATVQQGTNTVSITVYPTTTNLTIPSNADIAYMDALLAKLTDGQTYTLTIGNLDTGVYPSTLLPELGNKPACNFKIVLDGYTTTSSFESGVKNLSNVISYDMSNASIGQIYDSAFYGCTNLEEVKLSPDTIRLNNTVFNGCTRLHELELPPSVSMVTNSTFLGSSLTKLIISSAINCGNTSTYLGSALGLSSITTVEIASTGSVPGNILRDCSSAITVTFSHPETITRIGSYAFENCGNLTGFDIPSGVTSVEGGAFARCKIRTADLSNCTTTSFGTGAFLGADITNLTIDGDKISSVKDFVQETGSVTNLTLKATETGNCPSFNGGLTNGPVVVCFDSSIKCIPGSAFVNCIDFTFDADTVCDSPWFTSPDSVIANPPTGTYQCITTNGKVYMAGTMPNSSTNFITSNYLSTLYRL